MLQQTKQLSHKAYLTTTATLTAILMVGVGLITPRTEQFIIAGALLTVCVVIVTLVTMLVKGGE